MDKQKVYIVLYIILCMTMTVSVQVIMGQGDCIVIDIKKYNYIYYQVRIVDGA